ncbi:MAG TPA: hypothetical protein PLR99_18360 [Polyangiaceae bacterium]|nr:hypothetical protein [Polyangiaceae bacterium]
MSLGKIAIFSFLGLGSALAFASGCGPASGDSYYCDATGCYQCDGFGCASVPPPTKAPCQSNAVCGADAVCTTDGCAKKCTTDAACPRGEVCQASVCVAPTTTVPPKPRECSQRSDCAANASCVSGQCQACGGALGPCACATKADCTGTDVCVAGSCTPKSATCTFSSECGGSLVCADGQCLAGCDATKPCGAGSQCERGVCKPTAPGGGCSSSAPCPSGNLCVAGSCAPQCTADPQCGAGKYCNQGACVVDTRPQPNCTGDTQCTGDGSGPPRVCLGGFCKYRCTTDQGCRTIDSRIGYCAEDLVCRSAQEAKPECRESSQCPTGKLCIDNSCR